MSRRKVTYEVELDTASAERKLDGMGRSRGGGGGVGGTGRGGSSGRPGRGGGGGGGGGAFLAGRATAGGGLRALAGTALRAAPPAAAATAAAAVAMPGGLQTFSDGISALTSEFKAFKLAAGANSPFRDAAIGAQARDSAIQMTANAFGAAGRNASEEQIGRVFDNFNRIQRQQIEGRRRASEIAAKKSLGPAASGAMGIQNDVSENPWIAVFPIIGAFR